MTKIRVGIDVDGVLRDFVGQVHKLAEEESGVKVERPSTYYYDITEQTGISFRKRIWQTGEWAKPVFEDAPLLPFAKEGFKKFVDNDKIDLYIVSAQTEGTEHHTTTWIEKNGFDNVKDIIYTSKKLEAPCQILIDDKVSNVKDYLDNARLGILQDTTYNQEFKTKYRIKNLVEAYNLLEKKYEL